MSVSGCFPSLMRKRQTQSEAVGWFRHTMRGCYCCCCSHMTYSSNCNAPSALGWCHWCSKLWLELNYLLPHSPHLGTDFNFPGGKLSSSSSSSPCNCCCSVFGETLQEMRTFLKRSLKNVWLLYGYQKIYQTFMSNKNEIILGMLLW